MRLISPISPAGIILDTSQPVGGKRGKEARSCRNSGQRSIHVPPGEGQMRWVVGALVTFKSGGEVAQGTFALAEEVTPPQGATGAASAPSMSHMLTPTTLNSAR